MSKETHKKLILLSTILLIYTFFSLLYINGFVIIPESIYPGFGDLNVVLKSTDCYRLGFNPYFDKNEICSCIFNYPFIWLKLTALIGLTSKHIYFVGFILILIFVFLTTFLFRDLTIKKTAIVSLVMISPPILLLLERCNIDVIIFELILCLYYLSKTLNKYSFSIYITSILIISSSLLKIYPVFILPILLLENVNQTKRILIFFTTSCILICYFIYNINEIKLIISYTPKPSELAYGRNVLLQEFVPPNILFIVSFIPFICVSMSFYFMKDKLFNFFSKIEIKDTRFILFFGGILILTGSYLFGNNWDYRLVFLIFLLPFTFSLDSEFKPNLAFKKVFYIIVITILFSSFLHRNAPIYNNYMQWFISRNFLMSIKYIAVTIIASFGCYLLYYILNLNFIEFKQSFSKKNK